MVEKLTFDENGFIINGRKNGGIYDYRLSAKAY